MTIHDEQLSLLSGQVARQKKLRAMLDSLYARRTELEGRERELAAVRAAEQKDVDRLEGASLAALFYSMIGKKDEQLDKEQQEACAAAAIESFCDEVEEELRRSVEPEGLFLRPRYSPGYGDFPIQWQKTLLQLLDAPKTIGLTATESCMLAPSKSVTAVIGLTTDRTDCHIRKCMDCSAVNCPFRR